MVTYIKENIITKLQKLYSAPRNPKAANKSYVLFMKNPLSKGFITCMQNIHWKAWYQFVSVILVKYRFRFLLKYCSDFYFSDFLLLFNGYYQYILKTKIIDEIS